MSENGEEKAPLDEIGHPKGTLAIVAVYGLLFADDLRDSLPEFRYRVHGDRVA